MADNVKEKSTQPPPSPAPQKSEKQLDKERTEKEEKPPEKDKDKAEKPRGPPMPTPGPKPMTSEEVKNQKGKFTFGEMVDLALASPEVGAVNFNILRMLLKDMVERAGIAKLPVKVSEMEAHQVQNFKDYVQGSSVGSPMPGVLRIGHQGATPRGPPPPPRGQPLPGQKPAKTPPDATQQQRPPTPGQDQQQQAQTPQKQAHIQAPDESGEDGDALRGQKTPKTPKAPRPPPQPSVPYALPEELLEKVDYLEKQLEALYQLPGNNELIEKAKAEGASVSDMWQIIQLNNRIAAAEAAIQKMASLIEDIARNMGKLGSQAKLFKKDAESLQATTSDVQLQGQGCAEQCTQLENALNKLQSELNDVKVAWKKDRDNLEQMLGVDLGKVPSFMKPTKIKTKEREKEGFERGTQTRKDKHTSTPQYPTKAVDEYIPPEEIAKMSPDEIKKKITPDEVKQMTPQIYKELSHDQKKAVNLIRKSMKNILNQKYQAHHHFREPMGIAQMSVDELAELPPKAIAERMPYEEAINLPADVLERLTEAQKEKVQKIISRGPSPSSPTGPEGGQRKSLDVAQMTEDQIQKLPPGDIVKKMSVSEAKALPESVLGQMNEEQKAAVKKVIETKGQQSSSDKKKEKKEKKKPPLGLNLMTKDQLKNVTPEEILEKMGFEEAKELPQVVLDKLSAEKQEAVQSILKQGPPKGYKEKPTAKRKTQVGLASMSAEELEKVSESLLAEMTYEEAKSVPESILERMTEDQKKALKKVVDAGPIVPSSPEGQYSEFSEGDEEFLGFWELEEEEEESYEGRKSDATQGRSRGRPSVDSRVRRPSGQSGKSEVPVLSATDIEEIAEIPAEEIADALTPEMAAAS